MPSHDDELLSEIERVRRGAPSLDEKLQRYRRDRETYERQSGSAREHSQGKSSMPQQRSTRWQQAGYTRSTFGGLGQDT